MSKKEQTLEDLLASDSMESVTFKRKQLIDYRARAKAEGAAEERERQAAEKAGGLSMPGDWTVEWDRYTKPGTIRLDSPKWGGCFLGEPKPGDIALPAIIYRLLADMLTDSPTAADAGGLSDADIDAIAERYDLYSIQDNGKVPRDSLRDFAREVVAARPAAPTNAKESTS